MYESCYVLGLRLVPPTRPVGCLNFGQSKLCKRLHSLSQLSWLLLGCCPLITGHQPVHGNLCGLPNAAPKKLLRPHPLRRQTLIMLWPQATGWQENSPSGVGTHLHNSGHLHNPQSRAQVGNAAVCTHQETGQKSCPPYCCPCSPPHPQRHGLSRLLLPAAVASAAAGPSVWVHCCSQTRGQQAAYLLLLAAAELPREGHLKLNKEVPTLPRLPAEGHAFSPATQAHIQP